jgi:SpoVK/Ycf46/Vps4 family AAA+-type ATPase
VVDLLKNNIIKLTELQENNYYTMLNEIDRLKRSNSILGLQLFDLEQKEKKRKLNEEYENKKKQKTSNRYNYIQYRIHDDSFSEKRIDELYNKLNNIEDIINLKDTWRNVRHNKKLQKLHNIITPLIKLNNMIGLNEIKKELFKVIIYYLQNDHIDEYLHTVIYGPPGVGKTEFAKIYADIFVRLGILETDKFIEIKRDDLVAKYLGQTSHRTKEILEQGMGGVIFLDEAYSLGNAEKRDSFAKESIDMINQYLSEKKNKFMFIIAGYEDELESCFFSFNKGLKKKIFTFF